MSQAERRARQNAVVRKQLQELRDAIMLIAKRVGISDPFAPSPDAGQDFSEK